MHAAATLGARAVAGARGHARMRKSEPVNVTKKLFHPALKPYIVHFSPSPFLLLFSPCVISH